MDGVKNLILWSEIGIQSLAKEKDVQWILSLWDAALGAMDCVPNIAE